MSCPKQFVSLEEIYIGCVLLYCNDTNTLQKIGLINKKCQDALLMIKTNALIIPNYDALSPLHLLHTTKTFQNEFQLFPNIQTIRLDAWLLNCVHSLVSYNHVLSITQFDCQTQWDLIQRYQNQIVSITIERTIPISFDLTNFGLLKRIRLISLLYPLDLNSIILLKTQRIDHLYIESNTITIDFLNFLTQLTIKKIVCCIVSSTGIEYLRKNDLISRFPNITFTSNDICYYPTVIIYSFNPIQFTHPSSVTFDLYFKDYFPSSLELSSAFLSVQQYTSIQSLTSFPKVIEKLPKSITSFHSLPLVNYQPPVSITIPSGLKELTLTNYSNLIDTTHSLLTLKLLKVDSNLNSLSNLQSVTSLTMKKWTDSSNLFLFPPNLKFLELILCERKDAVNIIYPRSIHDIIINRSDDFLSTLPYDLPSLSIYSSQLHRLSLEHLNHLTYLHVSNERINFSLPSCLKHILIERVERTTFNLSKLSKLQTLQFHKCSQVSVSLPTRLTSLQLQQSNVDFITLNDTTTLLSVDSLNNSPLLLDNRFFKNDQLNQFRFLIPITK